MRCKSHIGKITVLLFRYVSYTDFSLMSQTCDKNTEPTGVDFETMIALPLLSYTHMSVALSLANTSLIRPYV